MNDSTQGVSPLRQRMIEDMRMRKLAPKTQAAYIRSVRQLAGYLGRSPDTATVEDLRNYQLHLVDRGTSPVSLNAAITGLKFMRRFLLHVLPGRFHRIRHYGLLANGGRKKHIATARELLHTSAPETPASPKAAHSGNGPLQPTFICRQCGAPMIVINTFERAPNIRAPP